MYSRNASIINRNFKTIVIAIKLLTSVVLLKAFIFHLILVDILSILILSVKNRGWFFFLLNRQNLLSVMKVICWQSLKECQVFSEKLQLRETWKTHIHKTLTSYAGKICHQVSFGELQLTKISLNCKTSYCSLAVRSLGEKLFGFSIILILKGIVMF